MADGYQRLNSDVRHVTRFDKGVPFWVLGVAEYVAAVPAVVEPLTVTVVMGLTFCQQNLFFGVALVRHPCAGYRFNLCGHRLLNPFSPTDKPAVCKPHSSTPAGRARPNSFARNANRAGNTHSALHAKHRQVRCRSAAYRRIFQ